MGRKSAFGAEPEQLRELLSFGLENSEEENEGNATASMGTVLERVGGRIDHYKLLNVLGEGGMGMVYLAEQERPIKRRVALKVIKPGMDSKRVISRFEAERQALALLDHPNIAHVYEAGATGAGRPYFVMEYVKGLPITDYCDQYKLTIEERLRLFQRVCQAVQHAHQKGIIHRDIKPSNIIVSTDGDNAIPKIIDFGVAKALAQPLTEGTLVTEESQLLGTPEYMSPEQADPASVDIDTRSDIYSLGILLYVLLTGVLPFDSDTLRTGGIDHIRKIIRETDPKTPSTRLMKLGDEATAIAENRRMEIHTLAKHLHRELEWIPLKAMQKERTERYRSASELADDIENYLKGVPLLAGPPSTVYRFKKFVRRNQALVTGISAVLIVLIVGVVGIGIFAVKAERRRVETQLISDFLKKDVLGSADEAKVNEATISYMLDAASEKLKDRFNDKPLVEAELCRTLGETYRNLGEYKKAERHIMRAIEIYRQQYGEAHPDTLEAMDHIGWVYVKQGRFHEMEELYTRILRIQKRVNLVQAQLRTMNGLAVTYFNLGKYEEAESLYYKIFQTIQRDVGEKNVPQLPSWKRNLAVVYTAQGRYKEAEQLLVKVQDSVVQDEDDFTAELAILYKEQGRYDEAESLLRKRLETMRQERGNEHLHTVRLMYGLAELLTTKDRYDEAQRLFNEALPIVRRRMRPNHPVTLKLVNARAVLHSKQKQYIQAERLFDEALKGRQQELGDEHPDTLKTKNDLGMLYKEQTRYDKAEPLFVEALKGRRLKLGDTHPHTLESWNNLIELYEACGKPEKAEEWRAKLAKAEAVQK